MKADMGGAAAVIATLRAAAQLKLPINVVGWVASAENMPSGTAIRPSDVLTMRGGKTVEVMNTDAEGRLVMADAIVRAGEESADAIVDIATLTGAQLVALGSRIYGVMSNNDDLRRAIVAAADAAGEQSWPMPLPEELRKSLDSETADLSNIGDRYGGMLVAGLFLQEFVPDSHPVGTPRRRRAGLEPGRGPRLHPEGRDRRADPDADRVAGEPLRCVKQPRRSVNGETMVARPRIPKEKRPWLTRRLPISSSSAAAAAATPAPCAPPSSTCR